MKDRSQTEQLRSDLEAAYRGSHWHSFRSALRGITTEEALWKPTYYESFPWMDGSIQKIIFHVGGDSLYQLDHALGSRTSNWEHLQAQFEQAGGDLAAALQLADRGFQALINALDGLSNDELARTYLTPEGKGKRTIEAFFKMMIEHHFYHAGQIVYIRSLWRGAQKA